MKKRYQELSKEEKNKNKDKFVSTIEGKNINMRLNRVLIIGIIGMIVSILLFISAYIKHDSVWAYVYAATILLFSIFFTIAAPVLKNKNLQKFYNKQK